MRQTVVLALCALAFGALAEETHVTLADRPRPASEDPNHYRVKAAHYRDREAERLRDADVVLLGDSITHYFEWPQNQPIWKQWFDSPEAPFKGLNQAIEGDTTDNLLWRMDMSLDKVCPKAFVVLIGTNNTGTRNEKTEPPEDTVKGLKRILDEIARVQPQAKTLVYALFPRGKGVTDPCTIRNDKVNAGLEKLCDGRRFIFRDIRKEFLAGDGTVNTNRLFDKLHPAPDGYRAWMADMAPELKKIFAAFDADGDVQRAYWERFAERARHSSRLDEERLAEAELKKLGAEASPAAGAFLTIRGFETCTADKPQKLIGKDETVFTCGIRDGRFHFSFDVKDADVCVATTVKHPLDLAGGDRVEVYFVPDAKMEKGYRCAEIDASGRVLSYSVDEKKKFDWFWTFATLESRAKRTADGYTVTGSVSVDELKTFGIDPKAFYLGVFRAEMSAPGKTAKWCSAAPLVLPPHFHQPAMIFPFR